MSNTNKEIEIIDIMKFLGKKKDKESKDIKIPENIASLDKDNFYDFIKKYPFCFIDFWAPWCQPCKQMNPRIRRLSKIFQGKVAFGKVNTQENQDLAKDFKVMSIPNFILFKGGKEKANLRGVQSVGEIKKIINKYL